MRLIGLMGKSKSGKDTVGQMLVEHNPKGATLAFADKLKEVCMDLFGLTHDDCYTEEGKAKPTDLPVFKCPACGSINCMLVASTQVLCNKCTAVGEPKSFASRWTPRMILQFIGTEGVRHIDKDAWVKHAIKRAEHLLTTTRGSGSTDGSTPSTTTPPKLFVAITDCRFKSEMVAIKAAGGEIWRIRRPSTDNSAQGLAGHASETEMDTIPDSEFNRVINNDASLDVLRGKAIEGLKEFLRANA
jgi:hypothetical protein